MDEGSENPFVHGNRITQRRRSYTIYAGKTRPGSQFFGDSEVQQFSNWLSTDSGEDERVSIIVLRVIGEYGDAARLSSGEWVPTVTLVNENGELQDCRFWKDQAKLPTLPDTYDGNNGKFLSFLPKMCSLSLLSFS